MPHSPLEEFVGAMTLSDLAARSGKSVAQIIAWAQDNNAAAPRARTSKLPAAPAASKSAPKAAPAAPAPARSGKNVNTRTPEGRAEYDAAVYDAVSEAGSPVGSSQLRKQVGGTPLQLRTSLNRLIESGKVTYEGKARATRYSLR